MANCKDCVHNDMCYITHIDISVACSEFLDKNKYVEVVHARWITDDKGVTYCENCRHTDDYASVHNYCPNCGANID